MTRLYHFSTVPEVSSDRHGEYVVPPPNPPARVGERVRVISRRGRVLIGEIVDGWPVKDGYWQVAVKADDDSVSWVTTNDVTLLGIRREQAS